MRILLAEDDPLLGDGLRAGLRQQGFLVDWVRDGQAAERERRSGVYNAAVLDLGLPEIDGLTVLDRWRKEGKTMPVLVLTARDSWSDKVAGLDAGADDYLPKPFALEELLARVGSLLRRSRSESRKVAEEPSTTLQFEDLVMDTSTRDVTRAGRPISLTRTEFALLHLLLQNPRHVLARQTILEEVWGYDFPTSGNALEVYIGYLRRKTEAGGESRLIHTVRGVGYVLRETAP